MSQIRRCSRPGCGKPAVATLTYAYSESTAVVGPLAAAAEPHSWDLCEAHSERTTAPQGWNLVRVAQPHVADEDDDLIALAEAVREAGSASSGLVSADSSLADDLSFGAHHPVHRSSLLAARDQERRAHLRVVPELDDTPEA